MREGGAGQRMDKRLHLTPPTSALCIRAALAAGKLRERGSRGGLVRAPPTGQARYLMEERWSELQQEKNHTKGVRAASEEGKRETESGGHWAAGKEGVLHY